MMRLVDGQLVPLSPEEEDRCITEWAAADAQRAACDAEKARLGEYDSAIAGDTTLTQLKAMTNAEFSAWWDANITTAAAAIAVLKRLARVIVRRVL